jgi:hypothetical protein
MPLDLSCATCSTYTKLLRYAFIHDLCCYHQAYLIVMEDLREVHYAPENHAQCPNILRFARWWHLPIPAIAYVACFRCLEGYVISCLIVLCIFLLHASAE